MFNIDQLTQMVSHFPSGSVGYSHFQDPSQINRQVFWAAILKEGLKVGMMPVSWMIVGFVDPEIQESDV